MIMPRSAEPTQRDSIVTSVPIESLPFTARWAIVAAYFTAFVCFEEFVIDRYGLAPYLPLYRLGDICLYDAVALLVILGLVFGGNAGARFTARFRPPSREDGKQ